MKNFEIKDKEYIYLLKYFDGDITNLNLEDLKSSRKGKFKGQEVEVLDVKIYKFFKVIVDIKKKEPKKYAKMRWKYPEWSKEEQLKKLKEKFPEDYEEESDEEIEDSIDDINIPVVGRDDEIEVSKIESITKSVIPQRKAFIDWINSFYEDQLKSHPHDRQDEIKKTKIYQFFVKQYLGAISLAFIAAKIMNLTVVG